ncbi:MAG: AgmX/PglI C-terminal domain-containing protein [bacterium]
MRCPSNLLVRLSVFLGFLSVFDPGCGAGERQGPTVRVVSPTDGNPLLVHRLRARWPTLSAGLRRCYAAARRQRPRLQGALELRLVVSETGRVKTFSSSSELPEALVDCVRGAVARWRFGDLPAEVSLGPVGITFEPGDRGYVGNPARAVARPASREAPVEFAFEWPAQRPAVGGAPTAGARIREVVRSHVLGLRRCYNKALIRNPTLEISLQVAFTVETTGVVSRLDVEGRLPLSGALMACFRRKMRQWIFFRLPIPVRYGPFVMSLRPRRTPAPRPAPRVSVVRARPRPQPPPAMRPAPRPEPLVRARPAQPTRPPPPALDIK